MTAPRLQTSFEFGAERAGEEKYLDVIGWSQNAGVLNCLSGKWAGGWVGGKSGIIKFPIQIHTGEFQ